MSLQHQNNKGLPKHLQHARIQKEEDEEQWISGEELCTEGEGSSDEDANAKFGEFKKRLKGSGQSSASSFKSRNCSSSNGSVKEKSDNNADPKSFKPSSSVEWRPKREDADTFYDIKAERLDTEMKWKSTLEELQLNKNLYKTSSTDLPNSTQMDTNKLLYDLEKQEFNFDDIITNSEYITDNIVTLDREIETFGTILEGCKKDRMVCEQDICSKIKTLNICKVTTQSTDKFHKICNFKKERKVKKKRRKTALNPRLYSRANKFRVTTSRKKMEDNPVTKLTKDQTNRLEDILADSGDDEINCFKHTTEQLENIAIIEDKLKTLQEKSDDADLNKGGCGSGITSDEIVADDGKNYIKIKDEKLRKINIRLKVLQNLKSTEHKDNNNTNMDNMTPVTVTAATVMAEE